LGDSEYNNKRDVKLKMNRADDSLWFYIIQKGACLLSLTPMPGLDVAEEYVRSYG
jgi:hypothetical protein